MFGKIKTISSKLLILGIIVALLIMVLVGLDLYQKAKQKEGLAENDLLKAPKEKIINYEIQSAGDSSAINGSPDDIIIYRYISTQEVPAQTYQGLEEDLSKRTSNSQAFLKSVKPINDKLQQEEYVAKFYSSQTFQEKDGKWYQIETATTTPTAFVNQTKLTLLDQIKEFFGQKVLATTATIYSGAGDGQVKKSDDSDWAITHDAITGETASPSTATAEVRSLRGLLNSIYSISRSFLPFDTSAIPSNATINSATLSVYITANDSNTTDDFDYINVVQTTQPSSATFTTADYDLVGAVHSPTLGATAINVADMTVSAYNTFTLNATGLDWIARSGVTSSCGTTTGVTCLGLREGHDLTDTTVTLLTASYILFSTSEETAGATQTDQDPYLTVTYTVVTNVIKINGGTVKVNGGTVKIN